MMTGNVIVESSNKSGQSKKAYSKPTARKVSFCYEEQIVASGGGTHMCTGTRGDAYVACRDNTVWTD